MPDTGCNDLALDFRAVGNFSIKILNNSIEQHWEANGTQQNKTSFAWQWQCQFAKASTGGPIREVINFEIIKMIQFGANFFSTLMHLRTWHSSAFECRWLDSEVWFDTKNSE